MIKERKVDLPDEAERLAFLQDQFGALLGVEPELLRGLEFCSKCKGFNYQWTDWGTVSLDLDFENEYEAHEFRTEVAQEKCEACDGSGFKGGTFDFYKEDWLDLAANPPK